MAVYIRYPDKALKDSYTPAVIKIQAITMALSLLLLSLALIIPCLIYFAIFFWGTIIVSTIPFALKSFKKKRIVGLISPGVILLRSLVFATGSVYGIIMEKYIRVKYLT